MASFETRTAYLASLTGAGSDTTALHADVAAEISAIAEKVTPASGDWLVIEDTAAADIKKRLQVGNLPGGTDADAIHDNVAGEIAAVAEKAAPVSADLLLIEDSAAANAKKRVQVGNLPFSNAAVVEAKTTAYGVVTADAGKTFTNEGASAEVDFTLPTAAQSEGPFTFINQDADGLRVIAAAGDTIRIGVGAGAVTATAGNIKPENPTDIGAMVTLVAINATEWMAVSINGAWTAT